MKTGGGALKGAAWERKCCKGLSRWTTDGKRDDIYWRTAMSGGRATFQLKQDIINRAQAGDMTAISPEGFALAERCLFEMKHYKDLNFTALLTNGTGLLAGFWRTTQNTAARLGKIPVLIAKQNHYPAVVLAPREERVFNHGLWATLWGLDAELRWFEEATKVERPLIKRPSERRAAE